VKRKKRVKNKEENEAGMKIVRFPYIDNIRSLVILLVVAMHASVCYSGIGGWYYKEGTMETLGTVELVLFAFLQSYTQAWFLGILFFISAYFAAAGFAKKGRTAFVKERLFRLGIPLLIYMFVIAPFIRFTLLEKIAGSGQVANPAAYIRYLLQFEWFGETGPLWFNEALIVFCLAYALLKGKTLAGKRDPVRATSGPTTAAVLFIIVGTAAAAFFIRLVFPVGTDVFNLQFSFFASYIALFVLGVRAGEDGWLDKITGPSAETNISGTGRLWFIAALAVGVPLWFVIMIAGGALNGTLLIYGGFYWQSAAYALWESFTAIAFSFGLLWLFKKFCNTENVLSRFVAANAFGVYMLHPPVLIGISHLLRFWKAAPAFKFLVVTPLAIAASLGVSALVRLVPAAKKFIR
jgi:surface polysaccharide O-acyltransferase-like enzyme